MKRVFLFLSDNLGHCITCMAKSFRAFAASVICSIATFSLNGPYWISVLFELAALSMGILWMMHIIVFAIKETRRCRAKNVVPNAGRRQVLGLIGRSAAIAVAPALIAALPNSGWPRSATDHNCYCCMTASPEDCECTTPENCRYGGGKCTMGGNC